jgi:hypothetical protein
MRTAPNLGQHNRQIACEILGLPESLFDELHHAKLFE